MVVWGVLVVRRLFGNFHTRLFFLQPCLHNFTSGILRIHTIVPDILQNFVEVIIIVNFTPKQPRELQLHTTLQFFLQLSAAPAFKFVIGL